MKNKGLGEWIGRKVKVYDVGTSRVHVIGILTNVKKDTFRIRRDVRYRNEQGTVFPRYANYAIKLVP